VLRTDVSGDPTVRTLVARVREVALGAFAHQDLPFERLVDELQPERSVGQNPLFQVAFAVQNVPAGALDLGRVSLRAFDFPLTTTRFDLEMHVSERADTLGLRVCYRTDLFAAATMRRFLGHYAALLESMAAAPDAPISALRMLGRDERRDLMWLNPPSTLYPRTSVASLFEAQARQTPDAVAIEYGAVTLTYAALNAAANALARRLAADGVGRGTFVGVLAERTPEMIVGLLAILKAGGAYVPLDAAYPAERLQFMIKDARLRVVLYHEHLRAVVPEDLQRTLAMIRLTSDVLAGDAADVPVPAGPDDLAYVIYTSGSTGVPKGVVVPQSAVLRLVCGTNYLEISPADRVAQASNASFDAATFEIWGALLRGARLVGIEKDAALSPAGLARAVADRGITILFLTTALFNQIARENAAAFSPLRCLLFGGEAVDAGSVAAVMRAGPPERLLHVYGPTESTTFATWFCVPAPPDPAGTVPIGRALSNSTLFVLDRSLEQVPLGVPGELFIGGDGLAHGYLNQPTLTAERFVPSPFGESGGRLYRTGDLVRWTSEGEIEFIGRNDGQVKVRGFRIELGEIEAALRTHSHVKDAVVVARVADGDRRLVAYVVPVGPAALDSWDDLRRHLRESLPDYMVPASFVRLDALPINANGKIDRRALPAPSAERQLDEAVLLPRNALEERIAKIWSDVLRMPVVGVSDNFFDLGGHSLRLLQVHKQLVATLGRDVAIVDLFRFPTIASLAHHLGGDAPAGAALPDAGRRARAARRRDREPIAIVGMAGRFPGAPDIETFWSNLRDAVESISRFSDEELRAEGFEDRVLADPRFVKAYGSLDGADRFDAGFFGYTPREAEAMDPQHRLFLETVWEALEHAGCDPARYQGAIALYAGAAPNTYARNLASRPELLAALGGYQLMLGGNADFLATRASYKLNLRGPSVTIQTACSTSLVAVHTACRSLIDGDCDVAIAGGVTVVVPLKTGYFYREEGIASPDGHCRAFDAKAQGTVGGSAVAAVVLKRLSDAQSDGDQIHAVILGSALNNDGAQKVGYTAPSVDGQAEAIALAQAAANVTPDTISYIEAHGTGTALGDPIEIKALSQAFGPRPPRSCAIGSLKTNTGHLDAAAGVAGLIKATLALRHRQIPPTLHFMEPNPALALDTTPFYVNAALSPWDAPGESPRRAGVSSFGIGGTNAHVVLEEAPALQPGSPSREWQLLTVSARTREALDRGRGRLADFLETHPDVSLADAAFTLQTGRRQFDERTAVVCRDRSDAVAALRTDGGSRIAGRSATHPPRVVFMFPGQGAQYAGMGRDLYRNERVFRDVVDECANGLRPHLGFDVRDVLLADRDDEAAASRLSQTAVAQPALFTIELALARLWTSWGIVPAGFIGHSLGEFVAAHLAGVWTLPDVLRLVVERSRLMQATAPGAMLAVEVSAAHLLDLGPAVSIAAVNSPSLSVLSGSEDAIAAVESRLAAAGVHARRLHTAQAFHSPLMEPVLDRFRAVVESTRRSAPITPFISNLTGRWADAADVVTADYWVRHAREAVQFDAGLSTLAADLDPVLLEVGPGRTLATLARQHAHGGRPAITSLPHPQERESDQATVLRALGRLWIEGAEVHWAGFYADERRRRTPLPAYAFERKRYWISPNLGATPAPVDDTRRPLERWFYVPSWTRSIVPVPATAAAPPSSRPWLIFADDGGFGDRLASEVARAGCDAIVVRAREGFARIGDAEFAVGPDIADDYRALLSALAAGPGLPAHIVHAWGTGPSRADADRADGSPTGFMSLMCLTQALGDHQLDAPLPLHVVTSGAQEVTGLEALEPERSLVPGVLQVIPHEDPRLSCRHLDVVDAEWASAPDRQWQALLDDLRGGAADRFVAYRGGYRWVQTFEPVTLSAVGGGAATRLRDRGTYLITGGLGGVGLAIARHLAQTVRARLILTSRRDVPARHLRAGYLLAHPADHRTSRDIRALQELEAMGAEVLVAAVDVCDERGMQLAVEEARRTFGPIHGAIHSAGIAGGGLIHLKDREAATRVLRPKTTGTRVLARALEGERLDFFVLCSSLASIVGGPGQIDYCAANAYLDAFAREHARRTGVPTVSIGWDTWSDAGMAVETSLHEAFRGSRNAALADGMRSEEGVEVLRRVLRWGGAPHVAISTRSLDARLRPISVRDVPGDARGRAQGEPEAAAAAPAAEATAAGTAIAHARPALATPYLAPRTDAERAICRVWEEVAGIREVGVLDDFFELGGHSLMALRITSRLRDEYGMELALRDFFEAPSVSALAQLLGRAAAPQAHPAQGLDADREEIEIA
jgi:amino acid adenylation domain-containing protein